MSARDRTLEPAASPEEGGATVVALATRNQGKVAELVRLLQPLPWTLVGVDSCPGGPEVSWDENGSTYAENAAIKARAVQAGTGLSALADDSGLELDAFGGWPGIHTATWMGPTATAEELLVAIAERVSGLPVSERGATFRCVLVFLPAGPGGPGVPLWSEGSVRGTLLSTPRGVGGFGYDPIFVPEGHSVTMAELAQEEKDRLSHRGRAARALVQAVGAARA